MQPTEIENLKAQLADATSGRRFILHGGASIERFSECAMQSIEATLKVILQMSLVLVWGARVPLVRIGRIAGQYLPPSTRIIQTSDTEADAYQVWLERALPTLACT